MVWEWAWCYSFVASINLLGPKYEARVFGASDTALRVRRDRKPSPLAETFFGRVFNWSKRGSADLNAPDRKHPVRPAGDFLDAIGAAARLLGTGPHVDGREPGVSLRPNDGGRPILLRTPGLAPLELRSRSAGTLEVGRTQIPPTRQYPGFCTS